MSAYLSRLMESEFKLHCSVMRIVLVCGPRQCGKTTLLQHMLTSRDILLSFDDADTLSAAQADPNAFLRSYLNHAERVAIDEVQKVPVLFGQIKYFVDREQTPGRILLSGSSNYRALPSVNESLAGRLGIVRLRTLTAAEIAGVDKRGFFADIINGRLGKLFYTPEECCKDIVLQKALEGGYPSVLHASSRMKKIWFRDYVSALVERDLLDIADFRKKEFLKQILYRMSSVSSQTVNLSETSRNLQEDIRLVTKFVEALRTMYLIDAVPAWTKRPYERMTKSPKWELTDTGLMSAVLGHYSLDDLKTWSQSNHKVASDFIGNLIETWVYNQLIPLAEADGDWSIFHLRSSQRQEIDFILENSQGKMILIEVKAGESVNNQDFDNIRWFKERNRDTVVGSVILYCGQALRDYGDNCYAVPMAVLWS